MSSNSKNKSDSQASYVLGNIFPVIQLVFEYLKYNSLCNAAQVCKLWSSMVDKERNQRIPFETTLIKVPYVNRNGKSKLKLFRNYVLNVLGISPSVLIRSTMDHYNEKVEVPALPAGTFFINSQSNGVIGHFENNSPCQEWESPFFQGHVFLSFQYGKNINVTSFQCKDKFLKDDMDFATICNNDIAHIFNPVILLFTNVRGGEADSIKLMSAMNKAFSTTHLTVVGGKCMELSVATDQNKAMRHLAAGIILSGPCLKSNLLVHSSEDSGALLANLEIMKRLMSDKMESGHIDIRRSLMIMMTCVGRGEEYYGKRNVECDVINEVFPGLKVYGFFSHGEIAYDSMKNKTFFFHAYTTVFCLLCF